jgi:hypothetical protein
LFAAETASVLFLNSRRGRTLRGQKIARGRSWM